MAKISRDEGFSAVEAVLIIVIVVLLGVVGWMVYKNHHKTSTASTAKTTATTPATQSPTTVATPTQSADAYAGWKQYCSNQEKSCFKYPADWVAKTATSVDPNGDGLQITSPNGTSLVFNSAVSGLGGACDITKDPHVYINKVIANPNVSGLYIVEIGDQNNTNHIGLVDGPTPQTGDTGKCIYYTTFKSHHDPSIDSWLEADTTDAFKTSDLPAAELILKSYTY